MRTLRTILSRIPSPLLSLLGFIVLALAETTIAAATSVSTDLSSAQAGPIANAGNWAADALIIPGTASLTGCAMGVAGVQHAVDAQKQNVIRYATGAAIGGTVGSIGCAAVPGLMLGVVNKSQGALITHGHLVMHALHHLAG